MFEYWPEKISCDNCVGACCRKGTNMELSAEEVKFLESAGTVLKPILPARDEVNWSNKRKKTVKKALDPVYGEDGTPAVRRIKDMAFNASRHLQPGEGIYQLETDCGYLDENYLCTVYESDERPEICGAFQPGKLCEPMRARFAEEIDLVKVALERQLDDGHKAA